VITRRRSYCLLFWWGERPPLSFFYPPCSQVAGYGAAFLLGWYPCFAPLPPCVSLLFWSLARFFLSYFYRTPPGPAIPSSRHVVFRSCLPLTPLFRYPGEFSFPPEGCSMCQILFDSSTLTVHSFLFVFLRSPVQMLSLPEIFPQGTAVLFDWESAFLYWRVFFFWLFGTLMVGTPLSSARRFAVFFFSLRLPPNSLAIHYSAAHRSRPLPPAGGFRPLPRPSTSGFFGLLRPDFLQSGAFHSFLFFSSFLCFHQPKTPSLRFSTPPPHLALPTTFCLPFGPVAAPNTPRPFFFMAGPPFLGCILCFFFWQFGFRLRVLRALFPSFLSVSRSRTAHHQSLACPPRVFITRVALRRLPVHSANPADLFSTHPPPPFYTSSSRWLGSVPQWSFWFLFF